MEILLKLLRGLFGADRKTSEPEQELIHNEHDFRVSQIELEIEEKKNKHIVCNGKRVPIKWEKVVLWDEDGGLKCEEEQYKKRRTPRRPRMLVAHWDVCLSTRSMASVLKKRGLSVHFGIDNDGTIYQLMDTQHVAWHARGVNNVSVGVEIANGVHLRFQKEYVKMGLPRRPVITMDTVHGTQMTPYTYFYPEQVQAFKALVRALHDAHDLALKAPLDKDGKLLRGVSENVAGRVFRGVVGHYHITTKKKDPGRLPLDEICREVSEEKKREKTNR